MSDEKETAPPKTPVVGLLLLSDMMADVCRCVYVAKNSSAVQYRTSVLVQCDHWHC